MWILLFLICPVCGEFIRFEYDKVDSALFDSDVGAFLMCIQACKKSGPWSGIIFNVDNATCSFKYEEKVEQVMTEWGTCSAPKPSISSSPGNNRASSSQSTFTVIATDSPRTTDTTTRISSEVTRTISSTTDSVSMRSVSVHGNIADSASTGTPAGFMTETASTTAGTAPTEPSTTSTTTSFTKGSTSTTTILATSPSAISTETTVTTMRESGTTSNTVPTSNSLETTTITTTPEMTNITEIEMTTSTEPMTTTTTTMESTTTAKNPYLDLRAIKPPSLDCFDQDQSCTCNTDNGKDLRITLADGTYYTAKSIKLTGQTWTIQGLYSGSAVQFGASPVIAKAECANFGRWFPGNNFHLYSFTIVNGYYSGMGVVCPRGFWWTDANGGFDFWSFKGIPDLGWYSNWGGPYSIGKIVCYKSSGTTQAEPKHNRIFLASSQFPWILSRILFACPKLLSSPLIASSMLLLLLFLVLPVNGDFIRFDYDKTDSALLDNYVGEFLICMETCKKSDQCSGIVFNIDNMNCTFKYEENVEEVITAWGVCAVPIQSPSIEPNTTITERATRSFLTDPHSDTTASTTRIIDDHFERSTSQSTASVTTTFGNTETSPVFSSETDGTPSTTLFEIINLNSSNELLTPALSDFNSTTDGVNTSTTASIPTTTEFDYYYKLKDIVPPSVHCNDNLRICNCNPNIDYRDMKVTLDDGTYFSAQSVEQSPDGRFWTLKGTVRKTEGVSVQVTRNITSIECQPFGRSFTAHSSKIYAFVIQNGYFQGLRVICPKGCAGVSAPDKTGFNFSKLKAEVFPPGWYSWPYGPYQIKAVYCNR